MERVGNYMFSNFLKPVQRAQLSLSYVKRQMTHLKLLPVNKKFVGVDAYKIRLNYKFLLQSGMDYKKMLIDELFRECGMNDTVFNLRHVEKKRLLSEDIELLKKHDLLPENVNITEKFLSCIEPFPYDPNKFKGYYVRREKTYATIKGIRDSIERQYLVWKLKTDMKVVKKLLLSYKQCLVWERSLSSTERNLKVINENENVNKLNVASKMYLLSLTPFNPSLLDTFQSTLFDLQWDEIAVLYPNLIKRQYSAIITFIDILRSKYFTDSQIKAALPFFVLSPPSLAVRLNYILKSSRFSQHKDHELFLTLLSICINKLKKLEHAEWTDLSFFKEFTISTQARRTGIFSYTKLYLIVQKYLDFEPRHFEMLVKHPKSLKIDPRVTSETIKFLLSKYTEQEILESLPIICYPREMIEPVLNNIESDTNHLRELGFVNGEVNTPSLFKKGNSMKRKSLELCLYFLDKNTDQMELGEDQIDQLEQAKYGT